MAEQAGNPVVSFRLTEREQEHLVNVAVELDCNIADAVKHLLHRADPAFSDPTAR